MLLNWDMFFRHKTRRRILTWRVVNMGARYLCGFVSAIVYSGTSYEPWVSEVYSLQLHYSKHIVSWSHNPDVIDKEVPVEMHEAWNPLHNKKYVFTISTGVSTSVFSIRITVIGYTIKYYVITSESCNGSYFEHNHNYTYACINRRIH